MKLKIATLFLSLRYVPTSLAQVCAGVSGPFTLKDISTTCNYDTLLEEYTRQVFDVTGAVCSSGSTLTAKDDFDAKLVAATTGAATGEDAAVVLCKALYDNADVTAFAQAANKNIDPADPNYMHFEQEFYNGRGDWQEEVETEYESPDGEATSVLRQDAAQVREFYLGRGSYSRVEWPDSLTNFDAPTCTSNAAMCCWPKDRQAGDGNGNCATPYDENCVDKDVADNTNMCFADLAKGNASTNFDSDDGFMVFPGDNDNGEGSIHCHGFAWADNEYDPTARYIGNNLFFVSMYDHMYQRGYVKNIPGMPMCGCMEQMPIATRSDCTQVDLTEDWEVVFDGSAFTPKMIKVEIDFNACRGRNNRNNDLWAYSARLYDEGLMTAAQFGKVGRVLTNDNECYHATEYQKQLKGLTTGYTHDADKYTQVAGRDSMYDGEPFGREAFNKAFFEQTLTKPKEGVAYSAANPFPVNETPIIMRACPDCTSTHKKIWYRRLTPVENPNFDLLYNILNYRSSTPPQGNEWNIDFSLHSSYVEAVSGDNPWQCPGGSFNYNKPFVGNCSPSGTQVNNQHSVFRDFPGPRPNVAYYINKQDNTGVQDYTENQSITRATGLTDVDIGNPLTPGNTWEDDGVMHIIGGGNDIWGHSDQFHYKSQPYSGDIDVSVHIPSFANNGGNNWAKAGVMLRSDNSADSTYVFMQLTGKEGINAALRRSKGNHAGGTGSQYKVGDAGNANYQTTAWLRIVKKQEKIYFYRGDGVDPASPGQWVLHATDTIMFPNDSYRVGLAVTSHSGSYTSEATFKDYIIQEYVFPTSAPSTSAMPTPWQPSVDIGNPQRDGSFFTSTDGSIEYVKGAGNGIWGSSDSFFFYNQQVENDAGLTATMYIKHYDNNDIYARAGLMIRDTNGANSANAFVGAAGKDQGVVFQSREEAGASTDHHKMIYANWNNHMWVKLHISAAGVVMASYKIEEADAWIVLGTTTLTFTDISKVQVGRAVTSGTGGHSQVETQRFSVV